MTLRSALLWMLMAAMARAQQKEPRKLPKWEAMDYGPFYSSSVTMPWSRDSQSPDGVTLKGITVKLDSEAPASLCFDTNLCRVAAGWTGGFLKVMGTPFEGTHRPPEPSRPALEGEMKVKTLAGPGWARQGDFKDPRSEPYVPLPANWARYRGLYVNGSRVVFSYTVGRCPVLELPGPPSAGGRLDLQPDLPPGAITGVPDQTIDRFPVEGNQTLEIPVTSLRVDVP